MILDLLWMRRGLGALGASLVVSSLAAGCGSGGEAEPDGLGDAPRVGVLLVSHGSRSPQWREMLLDVEGRVRERVLATPDVASVRTAYMEYTEPSIATQLEAIDRERHTDALLVPLLLTVSGHSFDDIPVISGQREDAVTAAHLEAEGIRRYRSRARVRQAPLLDFPGVLRHNVARRVAAFDVDLRRSGVVLVAYGDEEYDAEWTRLVEQLGAHLTAELGVMTTAHAWCGHLVHYDRAPTRDAIARVLERAERAIVIPLLVAVDERFQHEIVGGAVREARAAAGDDAGARVLYRPDAILPEPMVDDWVVQIVATTVAEAAESPR